MDTYAVSLLYHWCLKKGFRVIWKEISDNLCTPSRIFGYHRERRTWTRDRFLSGSCSLRWHAQSPVRRWRRPPKPAAPARQRVADAASRDQLAALLAEFQSHPEDAALRDEIVALAKTLNPAPAIPQPAQDDFARVSAQLAAASSAEEFKAAARLFEQTAAQAPGMPMPTGTPPRPMPRPLTSTAPGAIWRFIWRPRALGLTPRRQLCCSAISTVSKPRSSSRRCSSLAPIPATPPGCRSSSWPRP